MAEGSIELLGLIADPLRVEMHLELHSPHLSHHPFFPRLGQDCPASIRQICHTALLPLSVCSKEVVFCEGELPVFCRMLFVVNGHLSYYRLSEPAIEAVTGTQSVSEAVLWTKWKHRGTLMAASNCLLLALDADKFQMIVLQSRSAGPNFCPAVYAREFVACLNDMEQQDISDLMDIDRTRRLVTRAFGGCEKLKRRRNTSQLSVMTSEPSSQDGEVSRSRSSRSSMCSRISGFSTSRFASRLVLKLPSSRDKDHTVVPDDIMGSDDPGASQRKVSKVKLRTVSFDGRANRPSTVSFDSRAHRPSTLSVDVSDVPRTCRSALQVRPSSPPVSEPRRSTEAIALS